MANLKNTIRYLAHQNTFDTKHLAEDILIQVGIPEESAAYRRELKKIRRRVNRAVRRAKKSDDVSSLECVLTYDSMLDNAAKKEQEHIGYEYGKLYQKMLNLPTQLRSEVDELQHHLTRLREEQRKLMNMIAVYNGSKPGPDAPAELFEAGRRRQAEEDAAQDRRRGDSE